MNIIVREVGKMKKILVVILILTIGISSIFANMSELSFFRKKLLEFGVSPKRADEFLSTYTEIASIMDINVNVFEILAIGWQETNWQNVMGDSNLSYGYFQIQKEAYWYTKSYYPQVYQYFKFSTSWDKSINRPDIQLVTMCLYLHMLKEEEKDSLKAYARYNGIGIPAYKYSISVWEKISILLAEYTGSII